MKAIIGLGNPGTKYAHTRHNIGFRILDTFAKKHGIKFSTKDKFKADVGTGAVHEHDIILVKPHTFMNLSGQSVAQVLAWHKLSVLDMLVVHDDLDTSFGDVRSREKGSSGGHNGVASLIQYVSTDIFSRLKIGIGRPPQGMDPAAYVLAPFTKDEEAHLPAIIEKSVQRIEDFLRKR